MSEPTGSLSEYYEGYWSDEGWLANTPDDRFPDRLRRLLASNARGKRVLDAGCGDGRKYGQSLARLAAEYVGVDISGAAVAAAQARGLKATQVDDLARLPLADASFDVVTCVEVLEHLVFPLVAARELHRVLKVGGVLIATVPNIAYWRRRLDLAVLGRWHPGGNPDGARRPWEDAHLRFFTTKTLKRMLEEAGFSVSVVGIGGSLLGDLPWVARRFRTATLSRPFEALERPFPSFFGANLMAIASKDE